MIKFDLDFTQNVQVYNTSLRFSSAAEYCTVQENILFLYLHSFTVCMMISN
jgi:hypothetical protein